MNDRIQEFSQNLAPQSNAVQFRSEQGQGFHIPFVLYIIGFLVLAVFIAAKSDVISGGKDGKKSGVGGSGSDSFGSGPKR
jgi:hypothetical protein